MKANVVCFLLIITVILFLTGCWNRSGNINQCTDATGERLELCDQLDDLWTIYDTERKLTRSGEEREELRQLVLHLNDSLYNVIAEHRQKEMKQRLHKIRNP